MSRIDERLEAMQIDASEMTTEEKFTAATGLTHYDEATAANDWYVPGGAANVLSGSEESNSEQGPQGPQGPQSNQGAEEGPQGEQGQQGNQGAEEGPQGEQGQQGAEEEPVTVAGVQAHIGTTDPDEITKYDLDKDGDVDEDDVTIASEIEVESGE